MMAALSGRALLFICVLSLIVKAIRDGGVNVPGRSIDVGPTVVYIVAVVALIAVVGTLIGILLHLRKPVETVHDALLRIGALIPRNDGPSLLERRRSPRVKLTEFLRYAFPWQLVALLVVGIPLLGWHKQTSDKAMMWDLIPLGLVVWCVMTIVCLVRKYRQVVAGSSSIVVVHADHVIGETMNAVQSGDPAFEEITDGTHVWRFDSIGAPDD